MIVNRPELAAAVAPPDRPAVTWEDAPCPLCGRQVPDVLLEAADPTGDHLRFAVVRCRHCRAAYTHPRPTPASMAGFYPADYRPHRRPGKMAARPPRHLISRLLGRPCPERRGGLAWHGQGRLLDFGCGGGRFLKRMADRGWQVTGLDAAVGTVRQVQEELGLPALVGSLPHPQLPPGSFDVVTMWHSLEHVHHPLAVLREAYRLLAPGGRLVVATPNLESWPFYWFGPDWFGLDLPRHLTHFTPASLNDLLQTAGFRVLSQRGLRHADWLRMTARQAAAAGRRGPLTRLLGWKPAAKAVAWACYAAGRSDCMMATAERPE